MRGVVLQPADCTVNGLFAECSAGVLRSRSEAAQRFATAKALTAALRTVAQSITPSDTDPIPPNAAAELRHQLHPESTPR
jgi:hypothetical protein